MNRKIIWSTLLIVLTITVTIGIATWFFEQLIFTPKVAIGADVTITLLEPANNAFLSGDIDATAVTNTAVAKVEFHFIEESGRFDFVYQGIGSGANQWQYTWQTNDSIDGIYKVFAVAVDNNNYSYLSEFNTIYVNNSGEISPETDQNISGTPPNANLNQNTNVNENVNYNINSNTNLNVNVNENQNENENINGTPPANLNVDNNKNVNENVNSIENVNVPIEKEPPKPDKDNDDLPDEEETKHKTDPTNPDSDNDDLTDGFEVEHGFNPLKEDNATPRRTSDNTLMQEIEKAQQSGDPTQYQDSDKDGIPDSIEQKIGTNPNDPDTSGDGLLDGFKAQNGYSLFSKNTEHIVKKEIELPRAEAREVERTSYILMGIILGILLIVVVIILILFHPKKTNI